VVDITAVDITTRADTITGVRTVTRADNIVT
jgi:hypothetical protein